MNDLKMYVKIVMNVLEGLKSECKKYECCSTTCKLYNDDYGNCLLCACPCDYDLQTIESRISEIIQGEMEAKKD